MLLVHVKEKKCIYTLSNSTKVETENNNVQ